MTNTPALPSASTLEASGEEAFKLKKLAGQMVAPVGRGYAEGWKAGYDAALNYVDALQAENQALRADAMRYRWLRSTTNTFTNDAGERVDVKMHPEQWDTAIDAAVSATGKGGQ